MHFIAVDDERLALKDLQQAILQVVPEVELSCFSNPLDALEYAREHQIDVAFLDVQMSNMNGLILAKHLKDLYPKTNIIFVTSYPQYSLEAFQLAASGYLLKPVRTDAILRELEQLRYPIAEQSDRLLRIQCFGRFEVFHGNAPLLFQRRKTEELFAYLVSQRGETCGYADIGAALWRGAPNTPSLQSNLRNLISDLTRTLATVDATAVLHKSRGGLSVVPELLDCDYYDFYAGSARAVNKYMGKFMTQFDWAEFSLAFLEPQ